MGLNKRGNVCLVSRMFFYMDTHFVDDSPYSMVWRWHLLSASPWLNLTSEGRHLESRGYPFFPGINLIVKEERKGPRVLGKDNGVAEEFDTLVISS